MPYRKKARLGEQIGDLDAYRRILGNDRFDEGEVHWNSMSKNTITLFQVLIDQDLTHLVAVLREYPRYVPAVCEHFRYAYSYSENEADIAAASELLSMGEAYFTKQFVRNLVRKLPTLERRSLEELKAFAQTMQTSARTWHPIVINHYCGAFEDELESRGLHPLQRIALNKHVAAIERLETFSYEAEDRDAALDIPYMN